MEGLATYEERILRFPTTCTSEFDVTDFVPGYYKLCKTHIIYNIHVILSCCMYFHLPEETGQDFHQ